MEDSQLSAEGWVIFDWLIIGLFGLDLVANFFTAFFDDDDVLITDKRKISLNYMKSWFVVDFLSFFPFDELISLNGAPTKLTKLARLPRLYRLVKSSKYFPHRLFKMVMQNNNFFLDFLKSVIRIPYPIVQLLLFFGTVLIGCHFIACMFIFIARLDEFSPDTWTGRLLLDPTDQQRLYITGLYYILTTLTTVGYGDIVPVRNSERIFCVIIMLFGVFMYSYTIGSLINIMSNINLRKNKLRKRLKILEEVNKEIGINKVLLNKIKKALRYDFTQSTHHKQKFFSELPVNLRTELLILMNQHLIKGINFFHVTRTQNRTPVFVANLIQNLKPMYATKNEKIYQINDPNDHSIRYTVFFLVKGRVALQMCMANGQFITIIQIMGGNYFGELDMLFEAKRTELAKTEVDSELLSLERTCFFDMCIDFPDAKEEILHVARKRMKVTKKMRSLARLVVRESMQFHTKQTFTAAVDYEDMEDLDFTPSNTESGDDDDDASEYLDEMPESETTEGAAVDSRRASFCKLHSVSRRMNSRSKLALRSDAKVTNDRKAFEILAIIGELERKVTAINSRLDEWDGRWNAIEGSLNLLTHQRRITRHATIEPVRTAGVEVSRGLGPRSSAFFQSNRRGAVLESHSSGESEEDPGDVHE